MKYPTEEYGGQSVAIPVLAFQPHDCTVTAATVNWQGRGYLGQIAIERPRPSYGSVFTVPYPSCRCPEDLYLTRDEAGRATEHLLRQLFVDDGLFAEHHLHSVKRQPTWAVFRFNRDLTFPRCSVKCGERWSFDVVGPKMGRLRAIHAGQSFEFAGGICLAEDVELIYVGPWDSRQAHAAGLLPATAPPPRTDPVHLSMTAPRDYKMSCGRQRSNVVTHISAEYAPLDSPLLCSLVCTDCLKAYTTHKPTIS